MSPIPITIITGFLGSGKTTLILNLVPQLPPTYKLALLKNEFGDVAVDSVLASAGSISGVRELLNGCICCNLVGQLSDALYELRDEVNPDRIVIETSGSAFPATLAMEVGRIAREGDAKGAEAAIAAGGQDVRPREAGAFVLDGVVSVIDVENWKGYEDTSVTAKMQARYTDLIVFNKWELVDERVFETCLDRVGDLDVDTAWVKSRKGLVDKDVILGIDGALIRKERDWKTLNGENGREHQHNHSHNHERKHDSNHSDEVEVLRVILKPRSSSNSTSRGIKIDDFEELLLSARKDEVYRIKGLIASATTPPDSTGAKAPDVKNGIDTYVLNWAFSRWNYTRLPNGAEVQDLQNGAAVRLTFILARGESGKWSKKLKAGNLIALTDGSDAELIVERIG